MESIAILGSGFGLYGYLPALAACTRREVVLPARYYKRFQERSELTEFSNRVRWERNEYEALRTATGAVLALCPLQQMRWLGVCLEQRNLNYLFLEKPLATTPTVASALQDRLDASDKVIRIAYLFRHLDWAKRVKAFVCDGANRNLAFRWRFMAHHFKHNVETWKREHEQGGGPLRFYGIHLIAYLAELGYDRVRHSVRLSKVETQLDEWSATFSGPRLPACSVSVSTASARSDFSVFGYDGRKETCLFDRSSPFELDTSIASESKIDGRVSTLSTFCESAWNDPTKNPLIYRRTVELWDQVERAETKIAFPVAA